MKTTLEHLPQKKRTSRRNSCGISAERRHATGSFFPAAMLSATGRNSTGGSIAGKHIRHSAAITASSCRSNKAAPFQTERESDRTGSVFAQNTDRDTPAGILSEHVRNAYDKRIAGLDRQAADTPAVKS